MFDFGFFEILVIGIVGLLVLGPERLPRAARTAGLWIGKIKRTVSGMQREISAQLEAEELRQKLTDQQKKLDESLRKAKQDVERIADDPEKPTAPSRDTSTSTEQRAASAASHLDDALETVHEKAPASPDAESSTKDSKQP
ncbi:MULTISPECIES: Sec-independent protein translocase protein TatB [unclassified Halomonas]|uniref:Sec-independent protein translocase protein TatB n=1 Tax=unclassified Halomonas TaxID=2609666 RepID=UPI0006DB115F|nr:MULTISPECIES: Sec-independent protein translocase protein TatB [unclassified Halomonas]KPQ21158.1 MAG: sec-independent protein translocase protein TatB [Halomonas sp. HL-93]SBR46331.1 Sec-independent protein translocase TatB [Halomonas sp. HL-93]SNY98704.1 Sec-independent protein translocase TatB [Halomonas sp. hl-4]